MSKAVDEASTLLRATWQEGGRKPGDVVLRIELIQLPGDAGEQASLVQLIRPRGVALRFYLLAVFEAQCRLRVEEPWVSERPLSGAGSWSDLIAIDGAYDARSGKYMPGTKQGRHTDDLRLRQVKAALQTLEGLGPERALVTVPRTSRGRRQYRDFLLMKETGRGAYQTPEIYTVPQNHWSVKTITIPVDFFLKGWIQVLNPSEVATWLILRALSQWATRQHAETGVYLYGNTRQNDFGLRRDAWEDGCRQLRSFGLIRHAHPGALDAPAPQGIRADWAVMVAEDGRQRYEPYRWQITDQGLAEDAAKVCTRELTFQRKDIEADVLRRRGPTKPK